MTAILILGLFTAFQESGSPPVAADTGMIHGVLVDTKRGEVAFTAEVRHPKGKPCIDAWGQRVQAFVGTAVAGGKPAEFADHFVFLAEVDVNDIYKGLVELGLQTEKHVLAPRAEGSRDAISSREIRSRCSSRGRRGIVGSRSLTRRSCVRR